MDRHPDDENNTTMIQPSDQGQQGVTLSYADENSEVSSTRGSDQDPSDRDSTFLLTPETIETMVINELLDNYWKSGFLEAESVPLRLIPRTLTGLNQRFKRIIPELYGFLTYSEENHGLDLSIEFVQRLEKGGVRTFGDLTQILSWELSDVVKQLGGIKNRFYTSRRQPD